MLYRKAKISDVEAIHKLISNYAEQGLMLGRSRALLYEGLREFTVAEIDGRVIAMAGLHIIWEDLAEVRALAVDPDYVKAGVGRGLIEQLIAEARDLEIPRLFALTYQPGFFNKCGFHQVSKDDLDRKVWKECINCPKFPNCDENAMVLDLKD